MQLREGEHILKVFHHHPTPFGLQMVMIIGLTIPFFVLLFVLQELFSNQVFVIINIVLLLLFAIIVAYSSLIYWLDKLVITNKRVVHINWRYITERTESDVLLSEIADIQTKEKGVLAYFKFLDYGTLIVATSSAYIALEFFKAPDPEGIRKFIYHVRNP